jgi:GTP cyclohydrolase I
LHSGVLDAVHLQEELANDIAREIKAATGAEHLGVYIQATHGCCENRGIMAHSSLTQTTVLKGAFKLMLVQRKNSLTTLNYNRSLHDEITYSEAFYQCAR